MRAGLLAANSTRSDLVNVLALRTRQLELGTDPIGGFIQVEGAGGVRIEQALGRTISRSSDTAADFVDSQLGTISLKGPIPTEGSVQGLANAAIKDANLNTATKTLFIDTKGMSPAQVEALKAAIRAATGNGSKSISTYNSYGQFNSGIWWQDQNFRGSRLACCCFARFEVSFNGPEKWSPWKTD